MLVVAGPGWVAAHAAVAAVNVILLLRVVGRLQTGHLKTVKLVKQLLDLVRTVNVGD